MLFFFFRFPCSLKYFQRLFALITALPVLLHADFLLVVIEAACSKTVKNFTHSYLVPCFLVFSSLFSPVSEVVTFFSSPTSIFILHRIYISLLVYNEIVAHYPRRTPAPGSFCCLFSSLLLFLGGFSIFVPPAPLLPVDMVSKTKGKQPTSCFGCENS